MHLTSLLLFLSAPTAIQAHASLAPHLASDLPLPRPAISPRDTPVAAAENGTTTTLVVEFAPNYTYPSFESDLKSHNIGYTLVTRMDPPGPYAILRGAAITLYARDVQQVPGFEGVENVWPGTRIQSKGAGFSTFGWMLGEKIE